jgi:putative membrane protein
MQNDTSTHRHGVRIFGWAIFALVALLVVGVFVAPFLYVYFGLVPASAAMTYRMPFFGFGWFFWPIGFILFLFLIFGAVRLLFFPWGRGYYGGRWERYGSPEEILRRRYARGEITKDQFDQMMRDLQQHG